MRIENPSAETVTIAGLAIAPGRVGEVEDDTVAAWLRQSPANPRKMAMVKQLAPLPPPPPLDLARAVQLCRDLTRDGRPRCDALSRMLGRRVSARERDAAC